LNKIRRQTQNVARKAAKKDIRTKKARKKTLMKLTAGVNFINILRTRFLYKIFVPKIIKPNVTREKLLKRLTYKKLASKMLMKFNAGFSQFH
jgi:hypothetical protein